MILQRRKILCPSLNVASHIIPLLYNSSFSCLGPLFGDNAFMHTAGHKEGCVTRKTLRGLTSLKHKHSADNTPAACFPCELRPVDAHFAMTERTFPS